MHAQSNTVIMSLHNYEEEKMTGINCGGRYV